MSEQRRKITQTTRTLTTSSSGFGSNSNRSAFGYWIPLVITVTAATVALGAWIWSERDEGDEYGTDTRVSESETEAFYQQQVNYNQSGQGGNAPPWRPGEGRQSGGNTAGAAGGGGVTGAVAAGAAGLAGAAAAGYAAHMHHQNEAGGGLQGAGNVDQRRFNESYSETQTRIHQGGAIPGGGSGPQGGFQPGPPNAGGFVSGDVGPMGAAVAGAVGGAGAAEGYYRTTQNSTSTSRYESTNVENREVDTQRDTGIMGRMSNAIGLGGNTAGRGNAGGSWADTATAAAAAVGAAGAAVVGSIVGTNAERDERKESRVNVTEGHFSDQDHWSEEADRPARSSPKKLSKVGTAAEFYSGNVDMPAELTRRASVGISRKRRTVAIVVSSVEHEDDHGEVDMHHSILSQLPHVLNHATTRVFVLIYAPSLSVHPLSQLSRKISERRASVTYSQHSTTSSYQNIPTPAADGNTPTQTPGTFPQEVDNNSGDRGILAHVDPMPMNASDTDLAASIPLPQSARTSMVSVNPRSSSTSQGHTLDDPRGSQSRTLGSTNPLNMPNDPEIEPVVPTNPVDSQTTSLYKTLHNAATPLVDSPTSIFPFTSQQGHKHILKSIAPEIVYIQESLCGDNGRIIEELKGWVRNVVVVIGDEHGTGGLVDTDDEVGKNVKGGQEWWKKESVTGVGRGVSVVEAGNVGDDFGRRMGEGV